MAMQSANLALRFLLEIAALIGLGSWGFTTGRGLFLKLALGIGAPLLVATVWALFGAPGAAYELSGLAHVALEVGIFAVGVVALYAAGHTTMATAFAIAIVINRTLMYLWGQ